MISMNLVGSGLEGYLTPLGSLSELSYFNIASNRIYGSIPRSFVNFPKMDYLDLHDNRLTGSIPPITSSKSPLNSLNLNDNGLEGTIPESLGMLTGLVTLNLGQNAIGGTIPSTLRRLTKLRWLSLDNNQLSGTIPVLDQSSFQVITLFQNYLTMGSLETVPLSTFSPNALINIKSNCLVYRIPGKPSQNVDATHCKGERIPHNICCLRYHNTWFNLHENHSTCSAKCNANNATHRSAFNFSGPNTTGCCCHGGRIRVVCHGEGHTRITDPRWCVLLIMFSSSPSSLLHLPSS